MVHFWVVTKVFPTSSISSMALCSSFASLMVLDDSSCAFLLPSFFSCLIFFFSALRALFFLLLALLFLGSDALPGMASAARFFGAPTFLLWPLVAFFLLLLLVFVPIVLSSVVMLVVSSARSTVFVSTSSWSFFLRNHFHAATTAATTPAATSTLVLDFAPASPSFGKCGAPFDRDEDETPCAHCMVVVANGSIESHLHVQGRNVRFEAILPRLLSLLCSNTRMVKRWR
mmetsp:Transcript_8048/g.49678  ORF Transcript_8048/g.49678 Transcript_8048/m.49678 type:complete len:229 (+) Transcript_8048:1134-1820(+)